MSNSKTVKIKEIENLEKEYSLFLKIISDLKLNRKLCGDKSNFDVRIADFETQAEEMEQKLRYLKGF